MVDEPRRPDAVGLTVRYEKARDAGGLVQYAPEFAALGS